MQRQGWCGMWTVTVLHFAHLLKQVLQKLKKIVNVIAMTFNLVDWPCSESLITIFITIQYDLFSTPLRERTMPSVLMGKLTHLPIKWKSKLMYGEKKLPKGHTTSSYLNEYIFMFVWESTYKCMHRETSTVCPYTIHRVWIQGCQMIYH